MKALISVWNKEGIIDFARGLNKLGVEIISTGGTEKVLRSAKVKVTKLEDITGSPEMLDGRVKTLHPKIFGGILAKRSEKSHMEQLKKYKISPIDIVVCNLYPFEETVRKTEVTEEKIIENIDIGGVTLLRAAAKNFQDVTVVLDPKDYEKVLKEIKKNGNTSLNTRKTLAEKAFFRTYYYDEQIDRYFRKTLGKPELLDLHYEKVCTLRYGENPHQKAAFFRNPQNHDANVTNARMLQGKELSFNNIVDADSAIELVKEFLRPSAVVIKHNNPCGAASSDNIERALELAHSVDPMSAFGGILALNRKCTGEITDYIKKNKWFLEIVVAPSFSKESLEYFKTKPNIRVLETGELKLDTKKRDIKKVAGGILVQSADTKEVAEKDLQIVSKKKPTVGQIKAMLFARIIAKRTLSNAVIFAKVLPDSSEVVTGVGAGQMARVDAVHLAAYKGGDRVKGSVMASDAFFPFDDAVVQAAKAGITAIIQPGGSINDKQVFETVDKLGIAMVISGVRNFRH